MIHAAKILNDILTAMLIDNCVMMRYESFRNHNIIVLTAADSNLFTKCKPAPGKTLFIDARNMGTMVTRRLRELSEEDILKIAGTYDKYVAGALEDEKGFCAVATIEDIAKQDYILTAMSASLRPKMTESLSRKR